jgi:SOS-response transcriptional repressor LexA
MPCVTREHRSGAVPRVPRKSAPREYPNRIHELRVAQGLTLPALARLARTNHQTVQRLEVGRMQLTDKWKTRLAPHLGVKPWQLSRDFHDDEVVVPVVGYIGAGEAIFYFDDQAALDYVAPPGEPEARGTSAVRVEGRSMLPRYYEGDLLFFKKTAAGVPLDCIGRDCVIRTKDGRALVKRLYRGSAPGKYRLRSVNGEDMDDVELDWATRVLYSKQA